MKVKRFLAQDMRSALARIRDELGDDAVILSSRTLDGGVEVVAATLPESELASAKPASQAESAPREEAAKSATSTSEAKAAASIKKEFEQRQRDASISTSKLFGSKKKDQQFSVNPLENQLKGANRSASERSFGVADERFDSYVRPEKKAAKPEAKVATSEPQPPVEESREMDKMRSELNGIRRLLEQRLNGLAWDQFSRRSPIQASVWERLNAMGVPAGLSKKLLESVKPHFTTAQAWRFAIASLSRSLPVLGTDIAANGGTIALLGATGVGKTTTIGKLATRYVLEHGPEEVALVTTDSYRVAAHEQLRTYGRILDVTVRVVDESHTLRQVLDSLKHKSLILIDTAGLNPDDPSLKSQLEALNQCREVRKLLVLACTSQAGVLAKSCNTYGPAGIDACILSKLDEAGTIGDALALAIDKHLPIAYETHGQKIPDDIQVAQGHKIVSRAVALSIHSDDEKERLMHEFGNLYDESAVPMDSDLAYGVDSVLMTGTNGGMR